MFIPPYAPVFKDGWVPPEFIGGHNVPANVAAAVAANAAAVAQMNDSKKVPFHPYFSFFPSLSVISLPSVLVV